MIPTPRVPMGIGPGNILPIPLRSPGPAAFGIDLTTVTAIAARIFDPLGVEHPEWTGLSMAAGVTSTTGTALYTFQGSEFSMPGIWRIAPLLTGPSGIVVPCSHVDLEVTRVP